MNPHRKGNAFPTQGVPGDPRLLDQLHRQQIRGPNMEITHTHSGTLITPKAITRAKVTPLPLTIVKGSEPEKFKIVPGYVNQVMPTLDAIDLNDTPKPEFTIDADTWVWIKCEGTFGSPDTYLISIVTALDDIVPTGTAITATGFVSFYQIGNIVFDELIIENKHSGGNLGVDSWGLYNLWWRA